VDRGGSVGDPGSPKKMQKGCPVTQKHWHFLWPDPVEGPRGLGGRVAEGVVQDEGQEGLVKVGGAGGTGGPRKKEGKCLPGLIFKSS